MTLIQEACKYASQYNWKVFPLIYGSKKPATSNGFHDCINDIDIISEWKKCNLGIATGNYSGIWALDIDVKKKSQGVESIKKAQEKYGKLPPTLTQRTPTGGYHLIFKMPDFEWLSNKNSDIGIDVRADRGYIVAPPSVLEGVGTYHWINNLEPVEAPNWLYQWLTEEYTKHSNKEKTIVSSGGGVKEGGRNVALFKYCSGLRGANHDYDEILKAARLKNQLNQPPLDDKEVVRTVKSAYESFEPNPVVIESEDSIFALGKTPGEVALEYLYREEKYISVGHELYKYEDGYYKALDEGAEILRISELFRKCVTNKNTLAHGYARTASINEALNFVKQIFNVPVEKTKPIGLNLKNGILKPFYSGEGSNSVEFHLEPHSPDEYFLFQADFEYDPEVDSSAYEAAINGMLDPAEKVAILRNIAAIIDIRKIKSKHTRTLKALILNGEGSNGKDSLRTWCGLLLGQSAFSNIPIQAFKQADTGRTFQIANLLTSRINWASESQKVAIDNCQIIKQIITGDPVVLEKKHKDPISFTPEIVMIFNANDIPAFESAGEAMSSRYAIISFPYIFKEKPDPSCNWERKADSRLKEDPEFIKAHIMPAFLNDLLKEFALLLKDGIDYGFQEKLMREIREEHNHLVEFINGLDLIYHDPKDMNNVYTSSSLFEAYEAWCIKQGFIHKDLSSGRVTYTHPNDPYDKVITNVRQFIPKLVKIFPRLEFHRTDTARYIGLIAKDKSPGF